MHSLFALLEGKGVGQAEVWFARMLAVWEVFHERDHQWLLIQVCRARRFLSFLLLSYLLPTQTCHPRRYTRAEISSRALMAMGSVYGGMGRYEVLRPSRLACNVGPVVRSYYLHYSFTRPGKGCTLLRIRRAATLMQSIFFSL